MDDRDRKKRNEEALYAWNQWKWICSIGGCPEASRQILKAEVANAFRKKFYRVAGDQLDSLFAGYNGTNSKKKNAEDLEGSPSRPGRESDQDIVDSSDEQVNDSDGVDSVAEEASDAQHSWVDWAHEFDCGILEKANSSKSRKNYKDLTWECIKRSKDPALKIIRGKLLGHFGIINEIAERFLRNNYPQIWEEQISLYSETGCDDAGNPRTLEDTLPEKERSSLNRFDKECLIDHFDHAFSNDNAAILFVYLSGMSLNIPELKEYVGLSNSTIYDRLNNVILPKIKTFSEECLQIFFIPGATNFVISFLMQQIKPEKKAALLLQRVEAQAVHQ